MGTPPQLTPQQREAALAKAAASRKRRAEVKAQIKSEELTIESVFRLQLEQTMWLSVAP